MNNLHIKRQQEELFSRIFGVSGTVKNIFQQLNCLKSCYLWWLNLQK